MGKHEKKAEEVAVEASEGTKNADEVLAQEKAGKHAKSWFPSIDAVNQALTDARLAGLKKAIKDTAAAAGFAAEVLAIPTTNDHHPGCGHHEHESLKRNDAPDDLFGAEALLVKSAPRMAQILAEAMKKNEPIQVRVNSQAPVYGTVQAVDSEVCVLEVWGTEKTTENGVLTRMNLNRRSNPKIAYIDIAAIDAVTTVPKED